MYATDKVTTMFSLLKRNSRNAIATKSVEAVEIVEVAVDINVKGLNVNRRTQEESAGNLITCAANQPVCFGGNLKPSRQDMSGNPVNPLCGLRQNASKNS